MDRGIGRGVEDGDRKGWRSPMGSAALAAASLGAFGWLLSRIEDSGFAIWLVLGSFVFAVPVAVFLVNAPRFAKEWGMARARPLSGVVYDGREIEVAVINGQVYANATQAAEAMGVDPASWPLRFACAGEGALMKVGGQMWARRDAWEWRNARSRDLSLRRMCARLERDGFGPIDRKESQAARISREQGKIAQACQGHPVVEEGSPREEKP